MRFKKKDVLLIIRQLFDFPLGKNRLVFLRQESTQLQAFTKMHKPSFPKIAQS